MLGVTAVLFVVAELSVASPAALPHVILMLADDLGNYEVGFHNPMAITPSIDTLANEGVKLERHYVYRFCAPTRAATMSGRLPFHVNQDNPNDINSTAGVDLRMTYLPEKLKTAGYATSMIGKSHLGARSEDHLPINRGFDQHFGFLGGGEDHNTQVSGEDPVVGKLVDLWRDHGPAYGENGTFSGVLYAAEAVRVIKKHAVLYPEDGNSSRPLFMYLAWHLVHSPLEAPPRYFDPRCILHAACCSLHAAY
jgi:arylsulfatase A-like enzyme